MRRIRTYHEVDDPAGAEVLEQVLAQRRRLEDALAGIGSIWVVASGKGGVGKSMVTANLAALLAEVGRRVGAADADLNGPSLARMLGVRGQRLTVREDGIEPASSPQGVRVMSMDLLLETEDAPLKWREPKEGAFIWQSTLETGALREFLADVCWGELDHLLIDVPPGTDKIERVLQLLPRITGVLLVTTPSEMARAVVARSASMLRAAGVSQLGLIANMTSHVCSACGHESSLFEADAARRLADEAGIPLLGEIPFDPRIATITDAGSPYVVREPGTPAAVAIRAIARRLEAEAPR